MNIYARLAELVIVVHFGIIAFVVLGQAGILVGWCFGWRWIRNPWFRLSHSATILIVAFEAMVDFECPLTTWEYDLRVAAGQLDPDFRNQNWNDNDFGFISQQVRKVLFYDPAKHGMILEASYYAFAGLTLATIFLIPPRFRRRTVEAEAPALAESPAP